MGSQVSGELPVLSVLDAGIADMMRASGARLVSSASLIQRLAGVLTPEDMESHERAAAALYSAVSRLWTMVKAESAKAGLHEGDILSELENLLAKNELVWDHGPIVAAGVNSADPHYSPEGRGARIALGDVIQIDVWAKEKTTAGSRPSIYADISWVGVYAPEPDKAARELFDLLVRGRDDAVRFIKERFAASNPPTGAEVDRHVRSFFAAEGAEGLLKHRTGHGIDRQVHGWGVNLDSLEFPDERKLLKGSCFSVEPGLYGESFGMRTEIDVYIRDGTPVVSGGNPQVALLTL